MKKYIFVFKIYVFLMQKTIHPFTYHGKIKAISSKSDFQRLLLMAALAEKETTISFSNWCEDTLRAKKIIQDIGAGVDENEGLHIIPKKIYQENLSLNAGESGLLFRMLAATSSLFAKTTVVHAKGTLLNRSIKPVIESLQQAGLQIHTENASFPITISGEIQKAEFELDASETSQILSGFLIATPLLRHNTAIHVKNLVSKPYINMTLQRLKDFDIQISHENYKVFRIDGNQKYKGTKVNVEGDWSAAANHLVAAAISGKIEISGLNTNTKQADEKIMDVLNLYGADIEESERGIIIKKFKSNPFTFDATDCPDLFPCLTVLAASCHGTSIISGTKRLIEKESNRLQSILENFGQLGLKMETENNNLIIHGTGKLRGGEVDGCHDHRIIMAESIAAVLCNKPVVIKGVEAVNKSYPTFFDDLEKITKR